MPSTAQPVEVRYCRDSSLRIISDFGTFQLSTTQLRILAEVYREADSRPNVCARSQLHAAMCGHRTLPPGRRRRGAQPTVGKVLSASQRAALSRCLRRLYEVGLIDRSRTIVGRTPNGEGLMAALRNWDGWDRLLAETSST